MTPLHRSSHEEIAGTQGRTMETTTGSASGMKEPEELLVKVTERNLKEITRWFVL